MKSLRRDARALSSGLFAFLAVIVIAALLYILLHPIADEVFSHILDRTSDADTAESIQLRQEIWGLILIYAFFLGGIMLIARSVFEGTT